MNTKLFKLNQFKTHMPMTNSVFCILIKKTQPLRIEKEII